MAEITPKTNTRLIGHDEAEAQLMHDFDQGKLAHGWIFSGPRGIGKATLAYRFARTLLSSAPEDEEDPVFRRIAAGSHTDLLVIEQLYDEKKEEKNREISVEQVRAIGEFLSLTPGEGKWRVVIIDSADALNNNSANAILKILEEPPPQTVLMLIAHNPSRLLPTIRSRCRSLKLKPLGKDAFISVMRHVSPSLESSEIKALAQLSAMAPGFALELHGQGAIDAYAAIVTIMEDLPALNLAKIHAFADNMGTGKVHTNWQLFTQLMLCLLSRLSLTAEGIKPDPISEQESAMLERTCQLYPAGVWAEKWQQVAHEFMVAERLHLDYKQVIITFFHSITHKEGFQIGSAAA